MKIRNIILTVLVIAYVIMWAGGIISYLFLNGPPSDAQWTAPAFLLLAGLIVISTTNWRERVAMIIAAVIGFAAEVIGVRYGIPFSRYYYTESLAPLLIGVPLVMMSAWMVLVAYVRQMVLFVRMPIWLELVIAGVWMTAIDLVIDPLAAGRLGYWRWIEGGAYYGVPAQNFFGWFIVSLIIFVVIHFLIRQRPELNVGSMRTGLSIVMFFTLIALASKLWIAGFVGLCLCVAHAIISKQAIKNYC